MQPEPTLRPYEGLLLDTKSFVPAPAATLVARPRLLGLLSQAVRRPLTLLAAPAGSGKTTLLADWLSRSQVSDQHNAVGADRVSWLSLDAGDNDPVRFWSYVMAALDARHPGVSAPAAALLRAPQPPTQERVLTTLVNALAAVAGETVLVFDDYHVIDTASIHQGLAFLLDHLPPRVHLVITTRSDPPLPIARLRARGHHTEVRAADLRFNSAEAAMFLLELMGLPLSAEQLAALETRTEGWAAGLQLAALALRDHHDQAHFVATFTGNNRYVVDYLIEEVLQRQPDAVQQFLLQTSILDRLSGPLCDAVLDGTGSQALLEQLEHAQLFLVPLDGERRWYRYHHLFAQVLRTRLQQTWAALVSALHTRASQWYHDHDQIAEAVEHALAARDLERAAGLIETNGMLFLIRRQLWTVQRWVAALPEQLVRARPRLCLLHATALLSLNQVDQATQRLSDAEHSAALVPDAEQHAIMLGWAAAVRGNLAANTGDLATAVHYGQRAVDFIPPREALLYAAGMVMVAHAFLVSGDTTPAMVEQIVDLRIAASGSGNLSVVARCGTLLAQLQRAQGQLRAARATFDDARQVTGTPGEFDGLVNSIAYYFGLGEVLCEVNELDAAGELLEHGMGLLDDTVRADAALVMLGYLARARLEWARGAVDNAAAVLEEFTHLARRRRFVTLLLDQATAMRVQLALARGDLAFATRWAATQRSLGMDKPTYEREREYLTLVRVRIAQARAGSEGTPQAAPGTLLADAMVILDQLAADATCKARVSSLIEIGMLRALAQALRVSPGSAVATLEQALELAEPGGYVRVFVDEGAPLRELLRRVPSGSRVAAYAATLLVAFGDPAGGAATRSDPLVEPLTSREREVLGLLLAGASNREIAERLVVSIGTAKKHVSNICGKLGVQSRSRAPRARVAAHLACVPAGQAPAQAHAFNKHGRLADSAGRAMTVAQDRICRRTLAITT